MTDAREIFLSKWPCGIVYDREQEVDELLAALHAAGFRIIGKDEVDPVTLEMAAEVAANWGSEIPAEIRALDNLPAASLKVGREPWVYTDENGIEHHAKPAEGQNIEDVTNASHQGERGDSLWVPASDRETVLGWTYDFEQIERISNAAKKATGYNCTLEVIEFVMAEADRRHKSATPPAPQPVQKDKPEGKDC